MAGKKSFSLLLIGMYFCNFGFWGYQSITRIVSSRKDVEPDAYCSTARICVVSLGSCIIFKKEMGPEYVRSLNCLADFVKRSEGCLRRGTL